MVATVCNWPGRVIEDLYVVPSTSGGPSLALMLVYDDPRAIMEHSTAWEYMSYSDGIPKTVTWTRQGSMFFTWHTSVTGSVPIPPLPGLIVSVAGATLRARVRGIITDPPGAPNWAYVEIAAWEAASSADPIVTATYPGWPWVQTGSPSLIFVPTGPLNYSACEALPAPIIRSYRDLGSATASRSLTGGITFAAPVTVATDAGIDSVPAVFADGRGDLQFWYHTNTDGKGYRSEDWGASWTLHATQAACKFPRILTYAAGQLFAAYVVAGAEIRFYSTQDWGVTLDAQIGAVAANDHPYALAADRHGILHLVCRNASGNLEYRSSEDAITWSAPATWLTGRELPALALGSFDGYLTCFHGDGYETEVYRINEDWGGVMQVAAAHPQGAQTTGAPAFALVDRRENLWVAPPYLSFDQGASWDTAS